MMLNELVLARAMTLEIAPAQQGFGNTRHVATEWVSFFKALDKPTVFERRLRD